MMKSFKTADRARRFGAVAVLALGLLSVPAVAAEASDGAKQDIVATAVSAGSFNTLAAALKAADLVEALQGPGPFTVLAPTDDAFAKLPAGTVESLLKPENKGKLQAILKYHVISGSISAKALAQKDSVKTLGGPAVTVSIKDGRLQVNQAQVVKTDIETSNGVIHVIDQVLLPSGDGKAAQADSPKRVIRRAISRGAPKYNDGDAKSCAKVYQEAARRLAECGDVPAEARHRLRHALMETECESSWSARAWTLRHALDDAAMMMD